MGYVVFFWNVGIVVGELILWVLCVVGVNLFCEVIDVVLVLFFMFDWIVCLVGC